MFHVKLGIGTANASNLQECRAVLLRAEFGLTGVPGGTQSLRTAASNAPVYQSIMIDEYAAMAEV
jgi:hypothetical protein